MNDAAAESSINETMLCVGNSMYPTLKVLDTLFIAPYHDTEVKRGDIIVFIAPGGRKVTHRIVSIGNEGIMTRGDNNYDVDSWLLKKSDIIGRVIYVRRGSRKFKISGGHAGTLTGFRHHLVCAVKVRASRLLKPVYHLMVRSGLFRIWLPERLKPRVLSFKRAEGLELQLMMGRKIIGSFDRTTGRWVIKPPFRLFIDEKALRDHAAISCHSFLETADSEAYHE
ncbi:signal peptidase I [Methanocella sp. MCL-LM]|uniref:signal peptidase I n=1 Tax=Methanocella sp. MCL-LM TaxID=3412035 RepID=UPI003C78A9F9